MKNELYKSFRYYSIRVFGIGIITLILIFGFGAIILCIKNVPNECKKQDSLYDNWCKMTQNPNHLTREEWENLRDNNLLPGQYINRD